jgi:hypothetical protein
MPGESLSRINRQGHPEVSADDARIAVSVLRMSPESPPPALSPVVSTIRTKYDCSLLGVCRGGRGVYGKNRQS